MMMLNKHSNGLGGFGDTFQSSTPVERKCEIANITSHIILTSHGARDPLLCNKINPGLQEAFHHPCIFLGVFH